MIAVTGATGHIGNVLVRELLAKGESIRAVVPEVEDKSPLEGLQVEIVSGDVRDVQSLVRAFTGVEMVYHLAGIISILPGKQALLNEVNVRGTRNVIEACRQTGVRRLVYTSSIHAVKEPPRGITIDESFPFDPAGVLGEYGKSKAQATLEVIQAVKTGLNAVIVCPTGVIGPYDFKLSEMGVLIRGFLGRKIRICVDGAYDFVDVRDVARGLILAAEKGRTGEAYILSGERITIPDFLSTLEKITGIKGPACKVPSWLARGAGVIAAPFYQLTKGKPLFTAYSIDVLNSNSVVTSEKAKRELGYTARSIQKSLVDAVNWFRGEAREQFGVRKVKNSYHPV